MIKDLKILSQEIVDAVTSRLGSFGSPDEVIWAETDVEHILEENLTDYYRKDDEIEELIDTISQIKDYINNV